MTVHNNILKKCLSSSTNWQFIAVCTNPDRWTLFSARWNTYRPVSMSSVSMSPNQYTSLSLSLSNDISSGLRSTILYALLLSTIYSVSPVHFFNIHSDSIYWSEYVMKVLIIGNIGSSVGVVTTLLAGWRGNHGSISSSGKTFFSFSKRPGRLWICNQCRKQWVPELSLGVKMVGVWD